MATPQSRVSVVEIGGIERTLNDLLLNGRDSLPLALNNRHHIAPSCDRAAQYRKDVAKGRKQPWRTLYTIGACDVDDGVPLSEVLAPYYRMIAALELRAAERALSKPDRPVPVLLFKAAREVNEYEVAALRYGTSEQSPSALEDLIREAADIPPVLADLTKAATLELVRTSRPERRLTLENR